MSAVSPLRRPKPEMIQTLGPLDEPGFRFTPIGLDISPNVTYEQWERYGRKLQLAEKGIQWALGDWVIFGEHHPNSTFRERASQAVEFTGLKVKTIQNYATVAEAIPKSRRRDSDKVDFSTHAAVAMLPEEEQEQILVKAESDADFSREDARKEAKRAKRRLNLVPDEISLLHNPEVQEFLNEYVDVLKRLKDCVPSSALFLKAMIESHIGQTQWQRDRTMQGDYNAIIESFEDGAYAKTEDDIYIWLIRAGYFMSDPDFERRIFAMALHSREIWESKKPEKPEPPHVCRCKPANKMLIYDKQGGRKDGQKGDMVDIYSLPAQKLDFDGEAL